MRRTEQNNRQHSPTGESLFKSSLHTALYCLTKFPKYLVVPKFTLFCAGEERGIWLAVEDF